MRFCLGGLVCTFPGFRFSSEIAAVGGSPYRLTNLSLSWQFQPAWGPAWQSVYNVAAVTPAEPGARGGHQLGVVAKS